MRRAFVPLVLLLVACPLSAAPPERTRAVTPADYATVNQITEIALSPDGKLVAYALAGWDAKADRRTSSLWVVDTDGKGTPKQLTKDRGGDRHIRWSADGKALYTLAARGAKAKTQVWKVALSGDAVAVTNVPAGVVSFDYAPKADTVFFTVDAKATDKDDFTPLREKFGKIDYGHGTRTVSELFSVKGDSKPEKLMAEQRYIREFAVTADGKKVAMISALDDTVIRSEGESRADVWENGKVATPPTDCYRAKASSPHAWLEGLTWNSEGTRFAFCAIFDAYPAEVVIGELKDEKWGTALMDRTKFFPSDEAPDWVHVRGYGSPLYWISADSLSYLAERDGSVMSRTHDTKQGVTHVPPAHLERRGVTYATASNPTARRRVDLVGGDTGFPVLMFFSAASGKFEVLVDPNPHTANWKFPSVQHVTWKSSDGASVGGPLELPFGWKEGDKPLPLVVAIHGGPTTASYNDLRFDPHNGRLYFAAAGYAVLCPNYRGSTGYGDKFVTDLIGNENDIDVKDIVTGIQHLIKEGIADPERIAVMGWSNGGYLTNCLITMKNPPIKIKAASSGAGILDSVAEWGFNDEPAYPVVFKKGTPWEQPEIYKKTSPTYGLGNVTTPTLIHVGANDERCPPGHSRMLYRALKEYKNVPTQLNVYPNQPHGLGPLSFRTAKMEWDLAWFEKYMKK